MSDTTPMSDTDLVMAAVAPGKPIHFASLAENLLRAGVRRSSVLIAIQSELDRGGLARDEQSRIIPGPAHSATPKDRAAFLTRMMEGIAKEQAELGRRYEALAEERDAILLVVKEDLLKDFAWLIRNPSQRGQHAAMRAWLRQEFGGEYEGVTPGGYYQLPDGEQQTFRLGSSAPPGPDRDRHMANVRRFLEERLAEFRPTGDLEGRAVVKFDTYSEEDGIGKAAYEPETGSWFCHAQRYRLVHSIEGPFSLDEVMEHIERSTRPGPGPDDPELELDEWRV